MTNHWILWFCAALLAMTPHPAMASPNFSEWGRITALNTGWGEASLLVATSFAQFDPEHCATSGYMTDPADPGSELTNAVLLTAYSTNQQVQFVVDGCHQGRPRIISVAVKR